MDKTALLLFLGAVLWGCSNKKEPMEHPYTNDLINESSPYLLQHAHNPVDWKPWNEEVLAYAQKENKPLLISIGYAACHWCHVMEEECFEDPDVAALMNAHFVNIKIDREERPDVDQIYMDALQLLTGRGGWPLNVVALPNGKPYWGATYLPKEQWVASLEQLAQLYQKEPERIEEYATKLTQGVKAMQLLEEPQPIPAIDLDQLDALVADWSQYFDTFLGGYKRAPKFMMPNNLDFLLHYGYLREEQAILDYVDTTLTRMAYGGLFDPIEGGFSRYSVDVKWHVPHFEKMLYDNGQLLSLYSKAFALSGNPLYKQTAEKTIAFVQNGLGAQEGGYYSSLDADSLNEEEELEEGAYYTWTAEELKSVLGEDYPLFAQYYNINAYGLWEEEGLYVLIRDKSSSEIASQFEISTEELEDRIAHSLTSLKEVRRQRPQPRLDDKILTSWNALYLRGLTDAARYLKNEAFLNQAKALGEFLDSQMKRADGGLYRNYKGGKASIPAFLDDYAALIDGYIGLFEVTGETKWLEKAKVLVAFCDKHFSTEENELYYYTEDQQAELIRRSVEISDNVISSSNSMMMLNLIALHKFYPKEGYGERATRMIDRVKGLLARHAQGHAHWLHGLLYQQLPFYEIAITGEQAEERATDILSQYLPNTLLAWTNQEEKSNLPLLNKRWVDDRTLIYVCQEGSCKLPVGQTDLAIQQLNYPVNRNN